MRGGFTPAPEAQLRLRTWGPQGQARPRAQASHVTLSPVKLPTQTNTLALKTLEGGSGGPDWQGRNTWA